MFKNRLKRVPFHMIGILLLFKPAAKELEVQSKQIKLEKN